MAEGQTHKTHRKTKEKKIKSKSGKNMIQRLPYLSHLLKIGIGTNPKAFAFAAPGRLQKQAARNHDV